MSDIDKSWLRSSFDHAAESYDSVAFLQREVADRLDDRLQYIKVEPKVILDIGSGTGYSASKLRQRYPKARVIELDIAPSMLLASRKKQGWLSRFLGGHQYLCADAENLPLLQDSVDLVFSSLAFQWCKSHEALFNEVRRVLKPSGLLMFSSLGPDTLKELRQSWAKVDDRDHVVQFDDMHDLGDEMMRAHMMGPVMDMEMLVLTYPGVKELMRDLKVLGSRNAMRARIKGLTGKHMMMGMIQAYETMRRDNVIPASYEVLYGHAWAPEQSFETLDGAKQNFPIPVRIMK